MIKLGFNIQSQSQIIALETGNETNTEIMRDYLEDMNVFGSVFVHQQHQKIKILFVFQLIVN